MATDNRFHQFKETKRPQTEPTKTLADFDFNKTVVTLGVGAGLVLTLWMVGISAVGANDSLFLKICGVLVLMAANWIGISTLKNFAPKGRLVKNGLRLGIYINAAAAGIFVILHSLFFLIDESLATPVLSDDLGEGATLSDLMATDVLAFIVFFGLGMIGTFILLQYYKSYSPSQG